MSRNGVVGVWRCEGVEVWRYGGGSVRRGNVELWRCGGVRCEGLEVWSCGVGCGGVEV